MKTNQQEQTTIHCADCGAVCIPSSCATGYAVFDSGKPAERKVCYSCADKIQRESLKDRSKKFCGYLNSDGTKITTWTGGELMRVVRSNTVRLHRQSFTHGKYIQSVRAVDCHGGHWVGMSSPGIAIKLRPVGSKL